MYLSKFRTCINADKSLKLTIDDKDGSSTACIMSWDDGLGFKLIRGKKKRFSVLEHEMTLLNQAHNNNKDLPIHNFIKSIPAKYQKTVIRQRSQQYSLLRIFRYVPAAYDLHHSNSLLLNIIIYRKISLFMVTKLIKMPQHKIIKVLYPENKSTLGYKSIVRILKRRIIYYGMINEIKRIDIFLKKLLSGELPCYNNKNILHIKYIPTYVLKDDFLDWIFLLSPSLVFGPIRKQFESTKQDNKGELFIENDEVLMKIKSYEEDTLYMARGLDLEDKAIFDRIYRANNFDRLVNYHDELVGVMAGHLKDQHLKRYPIPDIKSIKPPLPGTDKIVPLRNYNEFINESQKMKNCLDSAGYIFKVKEGFCYIYSVRTENDRCTLELGINEDKTCFIKQLESFSNSPPLTETLELVESWLAESSIYY